MGGEKYFLAWWRRRDVRESGSRERILGFNSREKKYYNHAKKLRNLIREKTSETTNNLEHIVSGEGGGLKRIYTRSIRRKTRGKGNCGDGKKFHLPLFRRKARKQRGAGVTAEGGG